MIAKRGSMIGRAEVKVSNWPHGNWSVSTKAIIDTGKVRCIVPRLIANELGVKERQLNFATSDFPDGNVPVTTLEFQVLDRKEIESAFIAGEALVLGSVLLSKMDLVIDEATGFAAPNPKHPNGPVFRV